MSDDRFEREVRFVLHEIAGEETPMSLRVRLAGVSDQRVANRPLWFSPPLRLATAGVALVAVLALAFLLTPRDTVGPPVASDTAGPTESVAPTPTQLPSEQPTPVPSPVVSGWTHVDWSEPVDVPRAWSFSDVIAFGEGYVGVGQDWTDAERPLAAFYASDDGLHWSIAYQTDAGLGRSPSRLVAFDGELFAFGQRADEVGIVGAPPGTAYYGPLVWRSTDGLAWARVDDPSWREAWGRTDLFLDVASGPEGIVAIGNAIAEEFFTDPLVLHSPDGQTWSRAELGSATEASIVRAVVAHAGGFAILGGTETGPITGMGTPEAWFSADGVTWTAATVEGATADDNQFDDSAVAAADGLFARTQMLCAGCRMDATKLWVSADGRSWQRASDLGIEPPTWVLGDGQRFVALATDAGWGGLGASPGPYPGLTRAWVSTDGRAWTALVVSGAMADRAVQRAWLVDDGVISIGQEGAWFATGGAD